MAKTLAQEFTKGLWDEIPPFRLVLGLCPVLAVTKTVENGIGMGLAKDKIEPRLIERRQTRRIFNNFPKNF